MTNEKILEKLHELAQYLPKDEKEFFDYYQKKTEILPTAKKYGGRLSAMLASLIADIEEEARQEARRASAKSGGTLERTKAAERVIKSAKKSRYSERLGGAWTDNAGRQCICDSFQAYRLKDALPLETLPANVQPVDLSRIIAANNGAVLSLPDVGELRAYIKTEKARLKAQKDKSAPLWDFGDGLPALNAEFLLTALEILPGCTATAAKAYAETRAVYFESDAGDGVVLPARKEANA